MFYSGVDSHIRRLYIKQVKEEIKESISAGGIDDIGRNGEDFPPQILNNCRCTNSLASWLTSWTGRHLSLFLLFGGSSQLIKFISASSYNYSLKGLCNKTINEKDKWKCQPPTLDPQREQGEKPSMENLIREKMLETSGWTSEWDPAAPPSPSPPQKLREVMKV